MTTKADDRSETEQVPGDKGLHEMTSLSLKGDGLEIDPILEKKLVRKIDLHLIPILFVLFLCAFIDR